jgi:alpha-tubulin N-acetyltransferase 1
MKAEGTKVQALLKVGVKKLFIRNEMGTIKEISPLCVLDFYVHESVQRSGLGKMIFEKML